MKKIFEIKRIVSAGLLIAAAAVMASCSDWTDQESIDITARKIADKNSALYKEYLQNLKAYKNSYHQIMMGWFDNSDKATPSRAGSLASLPDSVDMVSLLSPDNLTDKEIANIAELQSDKGTKVIFRLDYEKFAADFAARKLAAENAGTDFTEDLIEELTEFMDNGLALIQKYNYDGVSLYFNGCATSTLSEEEKSEYEDIQEVIFGKVEAAKEDPANEGKMFIFEGLPQFVTDTDVFEMFSYIVIHAYATTTNANGISFEVLKSLTVGVPTDRTIVTSIPFKLNVDDDDRGIFDGGKSAITETAYWMSVGSSYRKAGMGVYLINHDYYNAEMIYLHVRAAIGIMNPSGQN